MNILDKALDYLACPADGSDMNRRGCKYVCKDCNCEYPIAGGVPCFATPVTDTAGGEDALKRAIGEKSSSNENPAAEVSRLAKIYAVPGKKQAISRLISAASRITGECKLNEYQAAMLQQAVTKIRYDIEAPDYRGTFVLPREYLSLLEGRKFAVDAACGPGENIASLPDIAFRIGVDISPEMAKRAQKLFGSEGLLFVQGDVCRLPVRSGSADAYMSFNALDRVPRLTRMATQINRVLDSSGVCILGACEPPQYECERDGTRIIYVPETERIPPEEMLRMAGLLPFGRKEFPWAVSTILDGAENLTTAMYIGKRC